MRNLIAVATILLLVGFISNTAAQNVNLQHLSYGGDALPPYKPPTTSTTTTEAPTTKSSSFFGGIKNWFRKTTTEAPDTASTTTTTVRNAVEAGQRENVTPNNKASSLPPNQATSTSIKPTSGSSGQRDYVNPNLPNAPKLAGASNIPQSSIPSSPLTPTPVTPANRRDYVNPNIPSSGQTSPSLPSSVSQPQTPTTPSGRRDYVNPNIATGKSPGTKEDFPALPNRQSSPSSPPSLPNLQTPTTPSGRRDYVNPNIATSKPPVVKEDFPALPPPRRPSIQSTPASPTGSNQMPSVWNNRPASPTQPSTPTGSSSPKTGSPMVSFVSTVRPGSTRTDTPQLATDNELITLSENLLSKDVNNLNKYITVNLQGQTKSYVNTDEAPNPLLTIDQKAFEIPTVAKMILLFNNYELDTSINEYVTPIEKKEENDFIDAVLATSVMRQAMLFLQEKAIVTPDPKTHRDLLKTIWFSLYSRGGGRIGSSGFEHIFMSELKNGTVVGLHNALYFNEEEQKGNIDYKGYLRTLDFGNKGSIVKYRFDMNQISKPVNAMFVGPSPELELALYTVCFEVRADKDCPVSLNGKRFNMPTYTFRYRGKRLIGSGFPEI